MTTFDTNAWLDQQDSFKVADAISRLETTDSGQEWIARADGDVHYALWMYLVDRWLVRRVGVGLFDLGDCNIADGYEAGYSPAEMGREALENDDTYSMMMGGE